MSIPTVTPQDIRCALLLRQEIALLDVRHEAAFATGHPLFAANMAADRIAIEAAVRLPRKNVPIVLYDDGDGLGRGDVIPRPGQDFPHRGADVHEVGELLDEPFREFLAALQSKTATHLSI